MPQYQPQHDILAGRIILITGAADGIGRATALAFAQHGATTILLDKHVANLESLYDQIEDSGFPQPAIYPLDLEKASPEDYETMAGSIEKEFGRLDGIVHNAAVMGPITPMHLYDIKDWYKVMQINLHAPFLLNQSCLSLLNDSDDARMLFVSDACGRQGSAYWGAYGVSKAGLEDMMQTLADELETNTNIRINSIDPGVVRTKMRAFAYPGENPDSLPTPDSIMPAFLFLMGPDSKQFTGQAFQADDFC